MHLKNKIAPEPNILKNSLDIFVLKYCVYFRKRRILPIQSCIFCGYFTDK